MILRPYQREAVAASITRLREDRSTLIVMPTGTGKTCVFVAIAGYARGRVLVLAHRDELVGQAADRFEGQLGVAPAVEKAEEHGDRAAHFVVGSVQTMQGRRLESWPSGHFSLIVVDEAHHAVAASYRAILDHFEGAKVIGVTATPDRQDARAMGDVFDSVAYSYELPDAVRDGWLVRPLLARVVLEQVDLAKIRVSSGADYSAEQLEGQIGADDVLDAVARSFLEYAEGRQILAYTPGVDSAHRLAAACCELRAGMARAIDGSTPTELRRAILRSHEGGEFQALVNCQVLTEGYDSPGLGCIAVVRPTRSRALYAQMLGRGLRTADEKEDCLVLDYVGATRRLDLVGPEDVLGGDREEVVREARERNEESGGQIDLLASLEHADREVRYRLEVERRKLARRKKKAVAPEELWALLGLREQDWRAQTDFGGKVATRRQVAAIKRFGVMADEELTRAAASTLLDLLIGRARNGLATVKQLRLITKRGLGDHRTTREEASARIDALAQRGWRTHV